MLHLHLALHPGPQATPALRGRTVPVFAFLLAWVGSRKQDTYSHDEEVQPAPGIGEELDEAIGYPLEQHLQDEDIGEDFVSVLQDGTNALSLLNVDVLEGLEERQQRPIVPKGKQATRRYCPPRQPSHLRWPVISSLSLSLYPLLHMAFLFKKVFLRCKSHTSQFSYLKCTMQ